MGWKELLRGGKMYYMNEKDVLLIWLNYYNLIKYLIDGIGFQNILIRSES